MNNMQIGGNRDNNQTAPLVKKGDNLGKTGQSNLNSIGSSSYAVDSRFAPSHKNAEEEEKRKQAIWDEYWKN